MDISKLKTIIKAIIEESVDFKIDYNDMISIEDFSNKELRKGAEAYYKSYDFDMVYNALGMTLRGYDRYEVEALKDFYNDVLVPKFKTFKIEESVNVEDLNQNIDHEVLINNGFTRDEITGAYYRHYGRFIMNIYPGDERTLFDYYCKGRNLLETVVFKGPINETQKILNYVLNKIKIEYDYTKDE